MRKPFSPGTTATDCLHRIRKAYRRRALELHPDRNADDVENKTRLFAELQTAFETLSDPSDRARFDSQRSSIFGGWSEVSKAAGRNSRTDVLLTVDVVRFHSKISGQPHNVPLVEDRRAFAMTRAFLERVIEEEIIFAAAHACQPPPKFLPSPPPHAQAQ